ncbi:MAG: hypothetical protein DRG59_11050 [Deltaproteobacteria bacterium]|nr:MAG: hypothetical protein DRG59_11050 [Deltaproteobacteria bacterium]
MPHKSGFSHGLAAFLSVIAAAFIVDFFRPIFPFIHRALINIGISLAYLVNHILRTNLDPGLFTVAFVAFFLAFVWGLLYHFARR